MRTRTSGSSPLTRGKPLVRFSSAQRARLIPAHAGKTITRADARPWPRAHPRSRGENDVDPAVFEDYEGSSPLTRGKQLIVSKGGKPYGLIPAHAGKTGAGTPAAS